MASFREAYSDRKQAKGGKGIGRITWLKAFSKAEIDSVYKNGKKSKRCAFTFAVNDEDEPKISETADERITTVRLLDYLPEYRAKCPTGFDTIARRIIAHFLESFILDNCPTIILRDTYEATEESLNRYFKTKLQLGQKSTTFSIDGNKFKLQHLCLAALPDTQHEVHYCACKRSVVTQVLAELLPAVRGNLTHTSNKQFVYAGYVSGGLLEGSVDEMRGRFDIPDEKTMFEGSGETTWQSITRKIAEKTNEYLADFLQPLRDKNNERIRKYVQMQEPKYRPLVKHRAHWFDRISPTVSDEELSVELYRLSKDYDKELLLQRPKKPTNAISSSIGARKQKFNSFLTEWNDQGISKLADYVIHRKATLEFFEESLELLKNDEYAGEDQIHSIICPMKTTSDDVPAEQLNLWIIDERLAFHGYLASDKPMHTLEPINTASKERGDLILFNRALSFADDGISSIVIVEFKRPMRDDYTDKENPIQQVYNYVRTIREGKAKKANGRPLQNLEMTPCYAYVVCDITPKLKTFMTDHDFIGAPDGGMFYRYNGGHKVYIEVMSFDKLLADSKKRNQIFFQKLNLHMDAPVQSETPEAEPVAAR